MALIALLDLLLKLYVLPVLLEMEILITTIFQCRVLSVMLLLIPPLTDLGNVFLVQLDMFVLAEQQLPSQKMKFLKKVTNVPKGIIVRPVLWSLYPVLLALITMIKEERTSILAVNVLLGSIMIWRDNLDVWTVDQLQILPLMQPLVNA